MAASDSSWLKHVETWSTVIGALGSVAVPILLYILAVRIGDRQHEIDVQNNERGLVIATVAYLLDDSPPKRRAGVMLITWLREKNIDMPPELLDQASAVIRDEPATATLSAVATTTEAAASPVVPAATTSRQAVSQSMSDALGGLVPRIFIQIVDDNQRDGADKVRSALQRMMAADGRLIIAPGLQKVVPQPPITHVELRFLKRADQAEAEALKQKLDVLLATNVTLRDLSPRFDSRSDVKRRTYELWFPAGPISVAPADR
jgi:hypothetical protein